MADTTTKPAPTGKVANLGSTLSVLVLFGQIIWFKERNAARPSGDYGKTDDLKVSFVERGWLLNGDGTIDVENAEQRLQELGMKRRTEEWEALKAASKTDSSRVIELDVFETLYCEESKGGKKTLMPVKYVGVSGNRRSSVFFSSMVERRRQNLEIQTQVPVTVKAYEDDAARLADQIMENSQKDTGFLPPSAVDNLLAARSLIELGKNQNELRRVFKDGVGQKLYGILVLDKRFPGIKIVERMCRKPEEDGFIRIQSVKFSDLPDLVLRSDPKALADKNAKRVTQGEEPIKPAAESDIAEYFNKVGKAPATNDPKVMKKETIKGLSDNFPANPVRAAFKAVMDNNVDGLKIYQSSAVLLNAVDAAILNGWGGDLEHIVGKLATMSTADRAAHLKKIVDQLSK